MLVLDIDDTLYLENDYVLSGFQAVDRYFAENFSQSGFFEIASSLHSEGLRGNVFDMTLKELGFSESQSLIQELVQIYREHEPKIELIADARHFIFEAGIDKPMGAITGGPVDSQTRKVRALGLADALNPIIYAGSWGQEFDKPHPRAWSEFRGKIDLEVTEFTYIGDNPTKDYPASQSPGWCFIRMRRPGSLHFDQPTPVGIIEVSDFDDILSLLTKGDLKL